MFEQPEAKRVRRDELFDSGRSDDSESGDEVMESEMRTRLNEQIARSLGLIQVEASDRQTTRNFEAESLQRKTEQANGGEGGGEDSTDEFEFQLFSNSAPTKVVLEDDTPGDGALVRRRPESYYIVTRISEEQKLRFAAAAVTGDQVRERAKGRSWGLELPWRVIHATSTGKMHLSEVGGASEGGRKGKSRPGKKKRVALRIKTRLAEEKAKLVSAKMAEKEEHIKDKKKRLNRAKKLRRRAKAREQKGGGGEGGAESGDSDDSA